MQHDAETELLGQPQHGQDVVVAMGVHVNDALAFKHLDQRFHPQIARRHLRGIAVGRLILSRYSCALMNCSRTSAAHLARVPGNGGWRIELVPFAIFIPPAIEPSGLWITMSSMVLALRYLR